MAWDFSKFKFLSRLDARSRIFVLLGGLIGFILLIYLGTRYFMGGQGTVGASYVAGAPTGLQSTPGGTGLSPAYQQALTRANLQRAEQARMTGSSAVATPINVGMPGTEGCIICEAQTPNVKNLLDDWERQGTISPDISSQLKALAAQNVTPEQYAAYLDKLVKEGKLTPEQARMLMDEYKRQHGAALLKQNAQAMDGLIKSGQLPLDAASALLDAQKNGMSPSQYAAELQRLVREGKISPATAQQLLSQYTTQCMQEADAKHMGLIEQMADNGAIAQDIAKQLVDLIKRQVSLDQYNDTLNGLVKNGKLTPDASSKLITAYQTGKTACGAAATLNSLIKAAENAAFQEISDLLAAKKITPDVAAQLTSMIQNNIPLNDFKTAVNQLVSQGKLTPQIAQLKIADYQKVKQLRDTQQSLGALQANNASPDQYAQALQRAVSAGIITPAQASQLLQEYQSSLARPALAPLPPDAGQFAQLQQRVAAGAAAPPTEVPTDQFTAAQAQVASQEEQDRQARLQNLVAAMTGQAQNLVNSWAPPTIEHKAGVAPAEDKNGKKKTAAGGEEEGDKRIGDGAGAGGAPLIKSGTILFAVLDTAVNSDFPDTPVMATIVEGKFKGAKLLGKLVTAKNVAGQLDRISLNFTLMDAEDWLKTKNITAYAIDPDTARTVMASSVNYHYLQRFGAIMATSFLQGYATAITNAGTSTTGIFGTSTTHNNLSPGSKFMVGLGQVGQTLGTLTQSYINIPPTVRVDSGVSLGILFMADVG